MVDQQERALGVPDEGVNSRSVKLASPSGPVTVIVIFFAEPPPPPASENVVFVGAGSDVP